jgi:aspartate carbamoyltransferase regulatory subunit
LVMVWRSGILPCLPILKCRLNSRCITTTDSPFLKNVSIANTRYAANQCSMCSAMASLAE